MRTWGFQGNNCCALYYELALRSLDRTLKRQREKKGKENNTFLQVPGSAYTNMQRFWMWSVAIIWVPNLNALDTQEPGTVEETSYQQLQLLKWQGSSHNFFKLIDVVYCLTLQEGDQATCGSGGFWFSRSLWLAARIEVLVISPFDVEVAVIVTAASLEGRWWSCSFTLHTSDNVLAKLATMLRPRHLAKAWKKNRITQQISGLLQKSKLMVRRVFSFCNFNLSERSLVYGGGKALAKRILVLRIAGNSLEKDGTHLNL